jgi:hypothetical protein
MNWLFHIDDLSDDMDDRNAVMIQDEIMTTYYHPDTYNPETHVGKLTKEFVSDLAFNGPGFLIIVQLLESLNGGRFPERSEKIYPHHGPLLQNRHDTSSR